MVRRCRHVITNIKMCAPLNEGSKKGNAEVNHTITEDFKCHQLTKRNEV